MSKFWFKFEWDAWRTDTRLRRCSLETRGFWIECICLMEATGECFLDGPPEELADLIGCSLEKFNRCVEQLQRTGAAEITQSQGYVKILSRRLLKVVNLREYNRLKQQEHRRQLTVNAESIEPSIDIEIKSSREEENTTTSIEVVEPQPTPQLALVPARKPAKKPADERKSHPAIVCVLQAAKRYPPKDLWDAIIQALGDKPDVEFFASCYTIWRSVNGNPQNYEKWLFEPARTGNKPEVYGNGNGQLQRYSGNGRQQRPSAGEIILNRPYRQQSHE